MALSPKSYWVWNHRFWCLESGALGPAQWQDELSLVEKVLEVDPRNFHAWNYRRKVLPHIPTTDEYAYTMKMISKGITNGSAWHHRSTYPIKNLDE
ncbi:Rab geranylgeranyltransferase, partial [Coelomomyces lativittatus]